MFYNHLTQNERNLIDFLFNECKKSISEIAKKLKRNKSTISRELKRNCINGRYFCDQAHQKSLKRRSHKHLFMFRDYSEFTKHFLRIYNKRYHGVYPTVHKISQIYPDIKQVSSRQVFNWIKSNKWSIQKPDRLRPYYSKGCKREHDMFTRYKNKLVLPYWARPKYINLREEYGHWEADLIIGKRQKNFDNLLTLTERKTRMLYARKVSSRKPMEINSALHKMIKENNLGVKSITLDNGLEFQNIYMLASWIKCKIYFCNPYASYERGTNENLNGLIRRTWKKGTNFNLISDKQLNKVTNLINMMPRKMFNWKSSVDMFKLETSK